jgi:condensin complex subunit 3
MSYRKGSLQQRRQIFIPIFNKISEIYMEESADDEMISLAQVGGMFLDWTDPQKAV